MSHPLLLVVVVVVISPFSTVDFAPRCYAPGQLELSWGMWRRWCRPQGVPKAQDPQKTSHRWESWSKPLSCWFWGKKSDSPLQVSIEPGKHRKVHESTFVLANWIGRSRAGFFCWWKFSQQRAVLTGTHETTKGFEDVIYVTPAVDEIVSERQTQSLYSTCTKKRRQGRRSQTLS